MATSLLVSTVPSGAAGRRSIAATAFAAIVMLFVHPSAPADAQEFDGLPLTLRHQFDLRGGVAGRRPTALVPDPANTGYREHGVKGKWLLGAEFVLEPLRATYQGRLVVGGLAGRDPTAPPPGAANPFRYHTDEAYLTFAPDPAWALHLGRRNLAFGQSLGINPVDFFARPLEQDPSLDAIRARNEQRGMDMIGVEWHLDAGSLQFHQLPRFARLGRDEPAQSLAVWSGLAAGGGLDYAFYARRIERRGSTPVKHSVGFSISGSVGDAAVAYADLRIDDRRGRALSMLMPTGQLQPLPDEGPRAYPVATFGLSYSFASGVGVNIEYTHDATGYSHREWRNVQAALAASSPPRSAVQGRDLRTLASVLQARTIRRNYMFVRLTAPELLHPKLSLEATGLLGLDDSSGVLGLGLNWRLNETLDAGIRASSRFGGRQDEFRLRPGQETLTFALTGRF